PPAAAVDPGARNRAGVRGRGRHVHLLDRPLLRSRTGRAAPSLLPRHPMNRLLPILLIAAVLGLSACGSRSENAGGGTTRSLTLMLDFFPNADHAGIYQAVGDGEFRRAGLD